MPEPERTKTGVSRRGFLRTAGLAAGGLLLWSAGACVPAPVSGLARALSGRQTSAIPMDVDTWLRLAPDGSVTLFTGKVEFGQGIQTAFGQLVADELDVPFDSVSVLMGSTDQAPFDNPTFGSSSLRTTGPIVRQAAAEMRRWLLELASTRLGVPVQDLATRNASVYVSNAPQRSAPYADLAAGQRVGRPITGQVPLKDPSAFSFIGTEVPRVDLLPKVTGTLQYGGDVSVAGMLHGKVLRPPSVGARLQSVDYASAQAMPGVVGVVRDGDFVGLAAERLDQANAALAAIDATWIELDSPHTEATVFDLLRGTPDQGQSTTQGDADRKLAGAVQRLLVKVSAPYVAHLTLEPQSALARSSGATLEVWSSTQAPFVLRQTIANALQRSPDSVVVHATQSGGAFGRKVNTEAGLEAARLAVGLGRPVRVSWTRDEEFQLDRFRPAMAIDLQAGLDGEGHIAGWTHDLYAAAYFSPAGSRPMQSSANAGAHAADVYTLPDIRTTFYQSHSPLPVDIWRANGAPVNALARETALDELAELAGANPVTFRQRLLGNNPRMRAVMDAAVQKANWTPGVGQTGRGIGIALDYAQGTWVAEVARVALDPSTGGLRVEHVDVAVDCGLVVNPDGARAQIEGGIIAQGVSPTLKEMVTFAGARITNASVAAYAPLRMTESPTVDVVFVEDKTQPMQGLGEPAVCPVSAAISNAAYDLLGVRLRDLPFTPDKIKAAAANRG
jgi:CO/xanthine dehydrogenase Mo-binding subunit